MKGCGQKIGPYDCCTIVTSDAKEVAAEIESLGLVYCQVPSAFVGEI